MDLDNYQETSKSSKIPVSGTRKGLLKGMDYLIQSIQNFAITQNEQRFDDCLDQIISKIGSLYTQDADFEWETLKQNFSKIKYLNELLNFYNINYTKRFIYLIGVFMESVDSTTKVYLREINWVDYPDIEGYLLESLNSQNPLQKLGAVTKAYDLLIPIIEKMRNEYIVPKVNDPIFLKTFDLKK